MIKKILLWFSGFLGVASAIALVAWCCGYDYDYRDEVVGLCVFLGLFFSVVGGFLSVLFFEY
jgi:hypothetical protein